MAAEMVQAHGGREHQSFACRARLTAEGPEPRLCGAVRRSAGTRVLGFARAMARRHGARGGVNPQLRGVDLQGLVFTGAPKVDESPGLLERGNDPALDARTGRQPYGGTPKSGFRPPALRALLVQAETVDAQFSMSRPG